MQIPMPQPGQKKCAEFLAEIRQRPWHGGNNAGIKTSDMIVEAAVRNACLAETFIRRDQVSEAFLVGTKRWHDRFAGEKVGVLVHQQHAERRNEIEIGRASWRERVCQNG